MTIRNKYYTVFPLNKESAKIAFTSNDVNEICHAMVAVALHEQDWKWVQDNCLTFFLSDNPSISGLAAICLGHVARIHRQLEKDKVIPLLKSRLNNPEIAGQIEDALNDIEMFAGNNLMATINKNEPPSDADVEFFLERINFQLPEGFIDFYKENNGAYINGNKKIATLWSLAEMLQYNIGYNVDLFAPEFFIFGSDGGGTAYAIEKATGHIFEIPFIVMSREDAVFVCNSFDTFIEMM